MRCVVDVVRFAPEHLDGVLAICRAEGWPSLPSDPDRALRVLQAPGVTTVVALGAGHVVGFAQLMSDGEIQAYLALLAVARDHRRRGIGRALVAVGLSLAGGTRLDLLSEDLAQGFYRSLLHREMPGFRLYPGSADPGVQAPHYRTIGRAP